VALGCGQHAGAIGQFWDSSGRVAVGKIGKAIGPTAVNNFTLSYSPQNTRHHTPMARIRAGPTDEPTHTDVFTFKQKKTYGDKGRLYGSTDCGLPSVWDHRPWQNQKWICTTWQDAFSLRPRALPPSDGRASSGTTRPNRAITRSRCEWWTVGSTETRARAT